MIDNIIFLTLYLQQHPNNVLHCKSPDEMKICRLRCFQIKCILLKRALASRHFSGAFGKPQSLYFHFLLSNKRGDACSFSYGMTSCSQHENLNLRIIECCGSVTLVRIRGKLLWGQLISRSAFYTFKATLLSCCYN